MQSADMPQQARTLLEVIQTRRAIFPQTFSDKEVSQAVIAKMLEAANWAPTHKRTEPWRFRVIRGRARHRLSSLMADHYRASTDATAFSQKKYEKTQQKPLRSSAVIATCFFRDPQERLPEWEEMAALACAVQNLWLMGHALGVAGYWSTPLDLSYLTDLLDLESGERCVGLYYLGYQQDGQYKAQRGPWQDKVGWIDR